MDSNQFDKLTRTLGASNSRRALLRSAIGAAATGVLGSLGYQSAGATASLAMNQLATDGLSVREAVGSERDQLIAAANSNPAYIQLAQHLEQQERLSASGAPAALVVEQSGAVVRRVVLAEYVPRQELSGIAALIALLIAILLRILGGSGPRTEREEVDGALLAFGIEANGSAGSYAVVLDGGAPAYFLTVNNNQVEQVNAAGEVASGAFNRESINAWSARPESSRLAAQDDLDCTACEGMCGLIFDVVSPKQFVIEVGACNVIGALGCNFDGFRSGCFVSNYHECQRIVEMTVGLPDRLACAGACRVVEGGCVTACEEQTCTGDQYFDMDACECRCPLDQPSPVLCNNQCVSSDCASGLAFNSETCECECPDDHVFCDDVCVDLLNDPRNCGECGIECPNGTCRDGACADSPCASELTQCDFSCVDVSSDVNHCGECGIVCGEGETCSAGRCIYGVFDTELLDAGCRWYHDDPNAYSIKLPADDPDSWRCVSEGAEYHMDLATTAKHFFGPNACVYVGEDGYWYSARCADCNDCTVGQHCEDGVCVDSPSAAAVTEAPAEIAVECSSGLTMCGDVCIDLASDPFNCGGCGIACASGQYCESGLCLPLLTDGPNEEPLEAPSVEATPT